MPDIDDPDTLLKRIAEATERVADYYSPNKQNLKGESASEKIVGENASLMQRMDRLISAIEGSEIAGGIAGKALRADALRSARENAFNARPAERQGLAAQLAYGMQRGADGQFRSANGFLNVRNAIGKMNLPGVKQALQEGHLEQAAGMFTTGVARNPYIQPFLAGAELRGLATGVGYSRDRIIGQRLGQQTQMGMAAGYQGPGNQGFTSGGGSFLASLGAMPSMLLGMNPNAFGGIFGANMSPAASVGYRMQFDALKATVSDPFGMLGYKDNLNIANAVGSKGYFGYAQTSQMTNAVRDLVKTTGMTEGVGLGAAVDTLDLAVKRLHMDVSDAADMMKNYGAMARGAGKDVATFAQETSAVLQGVSSQNAVGPGALGVSALMSSIPQVSGQGILGMLTSPVNTALTMGSMAGQGASTSALATMALGGGYGLGGGTQEYALMSQQVGSFKNMVDQIIQSSGGDKQLGYTIASKIYNVSPLAIKQLYEHGSKMVQQGNVMGMMDRMKGMSEFKYGSKYGIMAEVGTGRNPKLSSGATEALKALNKSAQPTSPGQMVGSYQQLGAVTVSSTALKGTDTDTQQAFQNYTRQVAVAYLNKKGQDRTDELYRIKTEIEQKYAGVFEYSDVLNAGILLSKASHGEKAAFAKLSTQYDLKIGKFDSSTFKSSAKNLEALKKIKGYKSGEYQQQAMDLIEQAQQSGLIKKGEAQWYEKQITNETGRFDLNKFRSKVLGKAGQQQAESQMNVKIDLTPPAKQLIAFLNPKKGSQQSTYMFPVAPPQGTPRNG